MWEFGNIKTEKDFAIVGHALHAGLELWQSLERLRTGNLDEVDRDLEGVEYVIVPPQAGGAFLSVIPMAEVQDAWEALRAAPAAERPKLADALCQRVGLLAEEEDKEPEPEGDKDEEPKKKAEAKDAPRASTIEDTDAQERQIEESLEESFGFELETIAVEGDLTEVGGASTDPVWIKVRLIKPGWGNKRDNHYYSPQMLKAHAHMFEKAPMYMTDHVKAETNVRNLAGHVMSISGYEEDGAPIASALIHHPQFAHQIRNMAKEKALGLMPTSIRAKGMTVPYKDDDREGRAVESFTDAFSLDFVTKAGAGGGVVGLETREAAQEHLSEAEVESHFATDLPAPVRERVLAGEYETPAEVSQAIQVELTYISEAVGAGRPVAQQPKKKKEKPRITLEEVEERRTKVNQQWGFGPRA